MEEAVTRKQNKIKEAAPQEPIIDISNLSISELAKRIESQIIDSKMLSKEVLEKCAVFYKARRGYTNEDIAEILQVCSRTVERYIRNVRLDNSLQIKTDFQNEILGEVLNNLRLRYERLWRLSYSDQLSDYEKARVIFMCDQIEMNKFLLLSRLGYLSKEQALDALKELKEEMEDLRRKNSELTDERLRSLTSQQFQHLREVWKAKSAETEVVLEKIVTDCEADNERQLELTGHVGDFKKLFCSVNVINGLCNN
jgi:predicted transcriptional regulator